MNCNLNFPKLPLSNNTDPPPNKTHTKLGLGLWDRSNPQIPNISEHAFYARADKFICDMFQMSSEAALVEAGDKARGLIDKSFAYNEIKPFEYEQFKSKLKTVKGATAAYLDSVKQLNQVPKPPPFGICEEGIDFISKKLSLLEGLIEKTAGVEELQELVEAEVNELGFELEDLEKTLKTSGSELVLNAIADYERLEKDSTSDPKDKAIARRRLEVIDQWGQNVAKDLPEFKQRWEGVKKTFEGKDWRFDFELTDLSYLETSAHSIIDKVAPLIEKYPAPKILVEDIPSQELLEKTPEREKGYIETLLYWVTKPIHFLFHPEEWSETTKNRVYCGLSLMQLTAQGIGFFEQRDNFKAKAEKMQEELLTTLPKDARDKAERDAAFLATLLSDKWNQSTKLADKIPNGGQFIKEAEAQFSSQPSSQEIQRFADRYKHFLLVSSLQNSSPYQGRLSALIEGGNLASHWLSKAEQVSRYLNHSIDELTTTQQELLALTQAPVSLDTQVTSIRHEAQRLNRELQKSLDVCIFDSSFDLAQEEIRETCFAIEELEERIHEVMDKARQTIDEHPLEAGVDLSRYGNKHKNLIKLARLFKVTSPRGVEVPLPKGVTSDQVVDILKKHSPEVFTVWEELGKVYGDYKGDAFLETDAAIELISKIDNGIEHAFAQIKETDLPKEVTRWLQKIQEKGSYLMVRSTGAEDTRELSNAGGNESPTYVAPTIEAFSKALGEVVRSYFGAHSLKNRLDGQTNPFAEALNLPVTSQELIGEPVGGAKSQSDIPISVVLFSNEPLYVGKEKFRVMRMSATYGHGEAVVGSCGVATDTALILRSVSQPDQLYVLYDNQEKPTRLAPIRTQSGKVELQQVKNSRHLMRKRALSDDLIHRLFEIGILSENYFEDTGGTDMEIVIKGNQIYPVQARPVNRKPLLPTYIDPKKLEKQQTSPIDKTVKGKVIVPGAGSVLEITNPSQILVAPTLKEAEGLYKKEHKLILIENDEPANSHPVVNFSGLGVPCLFVKDKALVRSVVDQISTEKPAATCMQSGNVYLWNKDKPISSFTSQGFITHPAAIAVSEISQKPLPRKGGVSLAAPKELQTLFSRLQSAPTLELLEKIKDHPWLQQFDQTIENLQSQSNRVAKPIAKTATKLQVEIKKSIQEITTLIEQGGGQLETLFHIKTLQTLLFTQSEGELGTHSVLSLKENFEALQEIERYESEVEGPSQFSDILLTATMSPNKEKFAQWKAFLLDLESKKLTSAKRSQLKQMIGEIEQSGALPLFFTLLFQYDQEIESTQLLDDILRVAPKKEQVAELIGKRKELSRLQNDLGGFRNPSTFEKSFQNLKKQIAPFRNKESFDRLFTREGWQEASPVTQLMALQTMEKVVDTYDLAIKEMMASREYRQDEKEIYLKEILFPFFDLLNLWGKSLPPENAFSRFYHQLESIEDFLKKIEPNKRFEHKHRQSGFDVRASVLGSGAKFDLHKPNSLEDLWTLIHQNHLSIQYFLTNELVSSKKFIVAMPSKLIEEVKKFSNLSFYNYDLDKNYGISDPSSISIEEKAIKVKYNIPLRDHSITMIAKYDKNRDEVSLKFQFAGTDEQFRWTLGEVLLNLLDYPEGLPLKKPVIKRDQLLEFEWNITSQSKTKEKGITSQSKTKEKRITSLNFLGSFLHYSMEAWKDGDHSMWGFIFSEIDKPHFLNAVRAYLHFYLIYKKNDHWDPYTLKYRFREEFQPEGVEQFLKELRADVLSDNFTPLNKKPFTGWGLNDSDPHTSRIKKLNRVIDAAAKAFPNHPGISQLKLKE